MSTNDDFFNVCLKSLGIPPPVLGRTIGSLSFTWRTGFILAVPRASFGGLPLGVLSPLSTREGRKVLGPELALDLFACGIHSRPQEILVSPQFPVGAFSRQVGGRLSFQAVSDSLGSVGVNLFVYINRL